MVSCYDRTTKKSLHFAINACLAPLYSVEGMHIITVEGIGDRQRGLHPVQECLANAHGSQCGFCTPGFVMSMYALLRSSKDLLKTRLKTALQAICVSVLATDQ
uniref:[2Fe-2S]-binding domain-containing protein n=1 Tax=Arundo donax TaxID=35708 RepID=A0A0A9DHN8_ARUDO